FATLRDTEPLLGHADGEAVVLVRRGAEAFAIGATCTHYSGPLAEGLVVGDTIRCPWHHACFDLRTGAAIGGPALNDLPCFELVRENDLLRVVGKKKNPTASPPAHSPSSVVVIGGGPAGAAAVEALRRLGFVGPVMFVGDEAPGPVDRPNLSKDFLAGTAPEEWIPLRNAAFYAEKQVDFVIGDAAKSIDRKARNVTLESGRVLEYGALLLATGASPARLAIPGADLPHVLTLRTLADSRAIAARAEKGKRAVVIGASFIGLEVAASLRQRGVEVDVVGPEEIPLARVLGKEAGTFVRKLHEAHGVRFHLEEKPRAIDLGGVDLESGKRLACDFVVIGVGVKPRVELAHAAGLVVENGIVVDARLRTSDDAIYAAGDVARYPDAFSGEKVRVEHFAFAERQGQHAAASILGKTSPFVDAPFFWSQHYDVSFCYVGHAVNWDRIDVDGSLEARDATLVFRKGEKILAVVTVGRDLTSLRAEAAIEQNDLVALSALLTAQS
ncbi:MAG: FAD-dependent oxidoreductase, partial [Polyangiaceae bacterium]